MDRTRLRRLLPGSPKWFWDCDACSRDEELHVHVEKTREACKKQELAGSLWSWCAPFFSHFHFELKHHKFQPSKPCLREARRKTWHDDFVKRCRRRKADQKLEKELAAEGETLFFGQAASQSPLNDERHGEDRKSVV